MSQNTGVVVVMLALACWPPAAHAQQPKPMQSSQQLRTEPAPELSFEKRWQPESFPAGVLEVRTNTVRTFPVTRQVEGMIPGAAPILPTHAFVKTEEASAPLPLERPVVRKVVTETRKVPKRVAVLDICERHNMRKVHYGKTWRCRR